MSFTFDPDTKERVRAATDIVDLIGSRLEMRRKGRDFAALCPWHNDTNPSLVVNPESQTWRCWTCGIGGDVFSFLMRDEGLQFPEALQRLAERSGIPLKSAGKFGGSKRSPSSGGAGSKDELYRALAWADEQYHRWLLESDQGTRAREYLAERGISEESIKTFGIGLAPQGWTALVDEARSAKVSAYQLESAGLAARRQNGTHYDRFRERIMFPIRDREKRVIAFGGRVMPGAEEAKYINSPETRLFHKSQQLYGLDLAHTAIRQARQALVVEGYTDVIAAHQHGVENTVAVLGTALGPAHLRLLRNYCETIVLLLDGDEAGQRRSDDVLELFLQAQLDVRVLTLPDGMDPADFLAKFGAGELRDRIASADDALEFKMRRVATGFDPLEDTHRASKAVQEMLALLAKVPTTGLISNESFRIRQNQILPRLAKRFSVPEDELRVQLSALRDNQSRFAQRRRASTESNSEQERLLGPSDLSLYEREFLELLIVAPEVAPLALERVRPDWLQSDGARSMLNAYLQLDFAGQPLEFEGVLVALESAPLKSLLVTLRDEAMVKLKSTKDSAEERLRVLTQRMGERQELLRRQQQIHELQQADLSPARETSLLEDVFREARLRQGIASSQAPEDAQQAPTDSVPGQASDSASESVQAARELPSTEQSPPG